MLVFFGNKEKNRVNGKIISEQCSGCGNTIYTLNTKHKYFHIYWLPFVSTGKTQLLVCDNCSKVYDKKSMTEKMSRDVGNSSLRSSMPFYHFTGLFLVLLFIGFISWSIHEDTLREKAYLGSPAVGDYYVANFNKLMFSRKKTEPSPNDMDDKPYDYGVFRIVDMTKDELILLIGNFTYEYSSDAKKAVTDGTVKTQKNYFTDYIYRMPKKMVLSHYDTGDISDVVRNAAAQ